MRMEKDVVMDALNLAIEAGEFSQKAAECFNEVLPEDQKYLIDVVTCTVRLSHMAVSEARDVYSGKEDDLRSENRIREYYDQLNEWKEKLGVLKWKKEHQKENLYHNKCTNRGWGYV